MLHNYQIELTTRCNFNCWYCTGRQMPQQDMSWDTYSDIISKIPENQVVMLQGEGEPTLWPHWGEGIRYAAERKLIPYSIINGSRVDVALIAEFFPRIGISLDTVDASEADQIGRYNLSKVLNNIELLAAAMHGQVVLHITKIGTNTAAVLHWAKERNLRCISQPLQHKQDYQVIYPANFKIPIKQLTGSSKELSCGYLHSGKYRYYTVSGTQLPCCYIKENAETFNASAAVALMNSGEVPVHCAGCRNLKSL